MMHVVEHSQHEVERIGAHDSRIDVARTFTLGNLVGNFPFPRVYHKQSGPTRFFAGRSSWSDAVIEFDEDPTIYDTYPELDFPGETYYGVIPIERVQGKTWRCKVNKVERKVP